MPKFTLERQYLLPVYQTVVVEAPDLATACKLAIKDEDGKGGWLSWDGAEQDYDNARATVITAAVLGEYESVHECPDENLDIPVEFSAP